jgi:hypothetical protein
MTLVPKHYYKEKVPPFDGLPVLIQSGLLLAWEVVSSSFSARTLKTSCRSNIPWSLTDSPSSAGWCMEISFNGCEIQDTHFLSLINLNMKLDYLFWHIALLSKRKFHRIQFSFPYLPDNERIFLFFLLTHIFTLLCLKRFSEDPNGPFCVVSRTRTSIRFSYDFLNTVFSIYFPFLLKWLLSRLLGFSFTYFYTTFSLHLFHFILFDY